MALTDQKIEKRLLRTREASHFLNLERHILHKLVWRGELKAIRRKGSTGYLFDLQDLQAWVSKHCTTRPTARRW